MKDAVDTCSCRALLERPSEHARRFHMQKTGKRTRRREKRPRPNTAADLRRNACWKKRQGLPTARRRVAATSVLLTPPNCCQQTGSALTPLMIAPSGTVTIFIDGVTVKLLPLASTAAVTLARKDGTAVPQPASAT